MTCRVHPSAVLVHSDVSSQACSIRRCVGGRTHGVQCSGGRLTYAHNRRALVIEIPRGHLADGGGINLLVGEEGPWRQAPT